MEQKKRDTKELKKYGKETYTSWQKDCQWKINTQMFSMLMKTEGKSNR